MHQSCFGVNISSVRIVYLNGEYKHILLVTNQCRSFRFLTFCLIFFVPVLYKHVILFQKFSVELVASI